MNKARITIEETATGWKVVAHHADVVVETDGPIITVEAVSTARSGPLDVTLEPPA